MRELGLGEPDVLGTMADFGKFLVDRQIVAGKCRRFALYYMLYGAGAEGQYRADPSVEIALAEGLAQGGESRLASAMAGSDFRPGKYRAARWQPCRSPHPWRLPDGSRERSGESFC